MIANLLRYTKESRKKIARCFYRNKILRKPSISSVEIINTLECNGHCNFCSNHRLSPGIKFMNKKTCFRILDEVIKSKIPKAIFLGGEGLLDPNIFSYFRYCKENNIITVYVSNGTTLNYEMIDRLAFEGVSEVTISIHDSIPELHDYKIGIQGAFKMAINAIKIMKSLDFIVTGKVIFSRSSYRSGAFMRVFDLCKRLKIGIAANPFMPVGYGAHESNILTDGELKTYYKICRKSGIGDHIYNGWNTGCPAGRTYLGFLPGGEILPCYFMPISIGNINEIGIEEALSICSKNPMFFERRMICPVAGDRTLFDKVLYPLYNDPRITLPVDISKMNNVSHGTIYLNSVKK